MANEYFQPGSVPAPNAPGSSAVMRQEFANISTGFDKLPILAGHANELVTVNATGTALVTTGTVLGDYVTKDGVFTLTNKTMAWADNIWVGFGDAATRNAGLGAGQVLLLQNNMQLPAIDGSLLTGLNAGMVSGVVQIAHGGTGSDNLTGAQQNLGINLKADIASPNLTGVPTTPTAVVGTDTDQIASTAFVADGLALKADANNAVLTGAPTAPTPPTGDNSARIATTYFVTDTLANIGAFAPSNATPLINGVASSGVSALGSRDDHVHPTDSTRAPITSPAFTGNPTAPTPATGDNDTSIATTAHVQANAALKVSKSGDTMTGALTNTHALFVTTVYPQIPVVWVGHGVGNQRYMGYDNGTSDIVFNNLANDALVAAISPAPVPSLGYHLTRKDYVDGLVATKAPTNSPALTGVPTAPTPATATNTTQLATTAFVQSLLAQQPSGIQVSNSAPLMNGVVSPGLGVEASRHDHVHPVDTSRAPASAATATGTSFTPAGNIAAPNVQAAIQELDAETQAGLATKVSKSGDTMTGTLTIQNNGPIINLADTGGTTVALVSDANSFEVRFGGSAGNTHFMVNDYSQAFLFNDAGQSSAGNSLTRKDYVDGQLNLRPRGDVVRHIGYASANPQNCYMSEGANATNARILISSPYGVTNTINQMQFITGAPSYIEVNMPQHGVYSIAVSACDARLKENIVPTQRSRLADIQAMEFVDFNFKEGVQGYDGGVLHEAGLIAQQLQQLDPMYVMVVGEDKILQPNKFELLFAALRSIQELSTKLDAAVAEIAALKAAK